MAEALISRLARMEAIENLLENNGELEDSEDLVVLDVAEIASGPGSVAVEKFVSSVPTRLSSKDWDDIGRIVRGRSAAGPGPIAEGEAYVRKRVSEGSHFPVEDSFHAVAG